MRVELMTRNMLPDMVRNAAIGALTCTGNEEHIAEYEPVGFLRGLIRRGHESVLEHINLTYSVDGVSRALLQELARHRHISLSVRSTRYTLGKILSDPAAMERLGADIKGILDIAASRYGVETPCDPIVLPWDEALLRCSDLAKYFIQEYFPTAFMLTLNARELRHILKLRSGPEALHEFRCLTKALYDAIPEDYRPLFLDCLHEEALGYRGEAGA